VCWLYQLVNNQYIHLFDCSTLPATSRVILAPFLSFIASFYESREAFRQFLYRTGVLTATALPAPVISISSLTPGSGKSPLVEYLAKHYWNHHGLASLVVQLGSRGTADETAMLLRSVFVGTPIKVESTSSPIDIKDMLRQHASARLVLLDNGLQLSSNIQRDIDIITINSLSPVGNGHLKPRGTLREPYRPALRRSDAVVFHHVDVAGREGLRDVSHSLSSFLPRHALQLQTQLTPVSLRSLVPREKSLDMSEVQGLGEELGLSRLQGAAVVCITGIGCPRSLEEHLRRLGARHVELYVGQSYQDSDGFFHIDDIEHAIHRVRELASNSTYDHACIIMTEKDYARQYGLWGSLFLKYVNEIIDTDDGEEHAVVNRGRSGRWGAYVLHSDLHVVEHDRRFSSQKAMLAAMLRLAIDSYRRRSYVV
jgi:tetraacyldisaccharide-1-P 4'-kinase